LELIGFVLLIKLTIEGLFVFLYLPPSRHGQSTYFI
uniref:Uncharacterized protein n=1 Tax=Aegilops tauschii subsp. strangulata TaxID=200361 RepID=A0A453IRI2_AEGTS